MRAVVVFVLALVAMATWAEAQAIVFVVRHAEKAESAGKDPALTERGRARAENLAAILRDAQVTAIYVSEFKRSQETAAALANAGGVPVKIVPAAATEELVAKLKSAAGNVLVIGHSNTIPTILRGLGIGSPPSVSESDYDDIFVVTLGERPTLVRLHYR